MSKEVDVKEQEETSVALINNIFVNTIKPVREIIGNASGTARKDAGGKWRVVIANGNQTQQPQWHDSYLVGVTNSRPEFPTTKMKLISAEGRFPYTFQEQ